MMPRNDSKRLRWLDYVIVLRPMLFFPGWSTLLAGYLIAWKGSLWLNPAKFGRLEMAKIAWLCFLFALAMGGCFLLNQLRDRESDRLNNKLFLISEGLIPQSHALVESTLLLILALILGFLHSPAVGLVTTAFILLTGYFYNFRPFILKDRLWGSIIANALMGWLAFALGWLANFSADRNLLLDSLPYLFFNTALYFYTTLPDAGGDQQAHKLTPAVKLGQRPVLFIAFILMLLGLISAFINRDVTALFITGLTLPFAMQGLWNNQLSAAVRTTKFGILFFAVAICLKIPLYFILMLAGFFLVRWYFKRRFDFDYPNFRGQ